MLNLILLWYKGKRPDTEIRGNFEEFRGKMHKPLILKENKKRPNTIPVIASTQIKPMNSIR